jgi:hypothetical protein
MVVEDKNAVRIAPTHIPENIEIGISNFFILADWNDSTYLKGACTITTCQEWYWAYRWSLNFYRCRAIFIECKRKDDGVSCIKINLFIVIAIDSCYVEDIRPIKRSDNAKINVISCNKTTYIFSASTIHILSILNKYN